MASKKRIGAVLDQVQGDFNLALWRNDSNEPFFGEYGTFLLIFVRHPPSRVQVPKALHKEEKRYEVYNARLDLHILKPDTTKHGQENNKSYGVQNACNGLHILKPDLIQHGDQEKKKRNGDCSAKHGRLHILKPDDATEHGHKEEKSGKTTTTSSDASYDHGDCLYDGPAEITLKEAINLRNSADRLKAYGDEVEISEIYLHAGLKFLKGAYLLECCTIPTPRDAADAFHSYIDAANLFNYCVQTNKKKKNEKIEVAALAYKCMEVAYLRIAFSLQNVCSSSQGVTFDKGINMSPHLKPKNYDASYLNQLLKIAEHATAAMDASMRYHRALELVMQHHSISEGHEVEDLSSVKKALDCNFYNVEDFIHLVTLSLKDVGI